MRIPKVYDCFKRLLDWIDAALLPPNGRRVYELYVYSRDAILGPQSTDPRNVVSPKTSSPGDTPGSVVLCSLLMASVVVGLLGGFIHTVSRELFVWRASVISGLSDSAGLMFLIHTVWLYATFEVCSVVIDNYAPAAVYGVGDVKASVNGVWLPELYQWRTAALRYVTIVLVIGAGALAGPEASMVLVGSVVTYLTAEGVSRMMGFGALRSKLGIDVSAMGAGVGIAGSFAAPITGVLATIDEIATFWGPEWNTALLFGCLMAAIASSCVSSAFPSLNQTPEYQPDSSAVNISYSFTDLALCVVVGALMGVVGACSSHFVRVVQLGRKRLQSICLTKRRGRILARAARSVEMWILAALRATAAVAWPLAAACAPTPNSVSDLVTFSTLGCASGYLNPLAALLAEDRGTALKYLITSDSMSSVDTGTQCLYLFVSGVWYFLLTWLTGGCSFPSGQIVPSMLIGGAFGRGLGSVFTYFAPLANPALFGAVGATGFLSAFTRTPLWTLSLFVEITGMQRLIVPLGISSVVAKWVSDSISKLGSVYEVIIALKGYPYLPFIDYATRTRLQEMRAVEHVCDPFTSDLEKASTRTISVCESSSVALAYDLMVKMGVNTIQITDDMGTVKGHIPRATVMKLIEASHKSH